MWMMTGGLDKYWKELPRVGLLQSHQFLCSEVRRGKEVNSATQQHDGGLHGGWTGQRRDRYI